MKVPFLAARKYNYSRTSCFPRGRRVQTTRPKCNNFVKNVNILEFGYYIWNPYEKCIKKSPNIPDIGSLIREIDVTISEI